MSVGVFRVSVRRPGPAAEEIVDLLRRHCRVEKVGDGEYDARMHDDMPSGTAVAAMSYVLDRERPDWTDEVSLRPTDAP